MSRYFIQRMDANTTTPPDELHVRFTVELPNLHDCHHALTFALDWIKANPNTPPNAVTSLLQLIQNFLPAPKPP